MKTTANQFRYIGTKIAAALLTIYNSYSQNVNIPDANFKAVLLAYQEINTNFDKEIQVSEAAAFKGNMDVFNKGISDLTGIEAFVKIKKLYCYGNSLTSLDVSKNTALTTISCYNNKLTSLDVSKNTALAYLYCRSNALTSLDVSKNTALIKLNCSENTLTNLNVANGNNKKITSFVTIKNPNLTCIQVDNVDYSTAKWTIKGGNINANATFNLKCGSK